MKNFYEQLKTICAEHKTTIYALEKSTGSGKGSFIKWRTSSPSADKLIEIADLLDVSLDYLVGRNIQNQKMPTDIAERHAFALSTELAELSKDERFVNSAKIYKKLPNKHQEEIYVFIRGVAIGIGLNIQQILAR